MDERSATKKCFCVLSDVALIDTNQIAEYTMLISLPDRRVTLVDSQMLPRYWAAVWSLFHSGGLAPSTLKRKLSHIEAFYTHADNDDVCLDDLIHRLDLDALGNVLEAFFVRLRNVSHPSSQTLSRWNNAFLFVRDCCERIGRNPGAVRRMSEWHEKIATLDRLYLGYFCPTPKKVKLAQPLGKRLIESIFFKRLASVGSQSG